MTHTVQRLAGYLMRHRHRSWDEVSTAVLTTFALVATAEAGFFGYVFRRFAPGLLDLAAVRPAESWSSPAFLACAGALAAVGFQFFLWKIAARGSAAALCRRVFGARSAG